MPCEAGISYQIAVAEWDFVTVPAFWTQSEANVAAPSLAIPTSRV